MGWRDRDYAKWTDEERRRFLGSGGDSARGVSLGGKYTSCAASTGRSGISLRPGAGLAVLISAGLLLLGLFPHGHPILSRFRITFPTTHHAAPSPTPPTGSYTLTPPHVGALNGPRSAPLGSTLTLRGSASAPGTITVEGTYGGRTWTTLAVAPAPERSYIAQIPLSHRGLLHLRVVYPDGSRVVGSIQVR